MDGYIWGLEAEGRETEQRRSILYCSAQRLPCFVAGSVVLFLFVICYVSPGGFVPLPSTSEGCEAPCWHLEETQTSLVSMNSFFLSVDEKVCVFFCTLEK